MENKTNGTSQNQHSKAVVIIGNGFDLSMDLKTSYKDFVDSRYFKVIVEQDKSFLEEKDFPDFNINENEMELADNGLAAQIHNTLSIQNWVDLEIELGKYCKSADENKRPRVIRRELFALRYFLFKYLQYEIDKKPSSYKDIKDYVGYEFLKQLLNYKCNVDIWDFNYTFTCQNILKTISDDIDDFPDFLHFPHGHLNECMSKQTAKLIIGTQYDPEIMQKCPFAIKALAVDEYANNRSSLQQKLDDAETLIIYGHSMGITDKNYFSKTLQDSNQLKKIFIISKDLDSVGAVLSNMDKISDSKFMERVTQGNIDCFYFTLPHNRLTDEKQREDFKSKIIKCFSR